MIERVVALFFGRRVVVWVVFLFVAAYGVYCWTRLPLEAYPDIADTTSQVITQVPGLAAEEVEKQITIPLEREIMGTPGMQVMRSKSTFGLSLITVVFRDGAEDYWSRQRLQERISGVELPYGAQPGLDPLTSPIGEIYRYTLESKTRDLRALSELQFWKVIPRLKQVPGIADVSNFGGMTTRFLLKLDPQKLAKYNVSLAQITQAINANNSNAGGSVINRGEQAFVVRGVGLISGLEDLGSVVVTQKRGVPVLVSDLGDVVLGQQERHGVLGKDADPDTIEGIVLLLKGENPSRVLEGVHAAVRELNENDLPKDVRIVPYLDRTTLVSATVHTVARTLLEGMIVVTLVLLLFLGSVRAALIVALTIPLSLLVAFIFMRHLAIPANLLSFGAIDFGIIVDGAIFVAEGILRRRASDGGVLTADSVLAATGNVARPVFFGMLIIITAYLPLFAFERIEYKLFSPMAYAIGSALIGALIVALALIPGLMFEAFRSTTRLFRSALLDRVTQLHERVLSTMLDRPRIVVLACGLALAAVLGFGTAVGRDFLPYLDEGSLWLQVTLPAGISLDKASGMASALRAAALEFKQVSYIVTQLGRNDDGTDPWTPSHIEVSVGLTPYATWPSGMSKQDLVARMAARFRELPGTNVGFTQPMIDGVLDKLAGAHSDLVVKVYGDDLHEARRVATAVVQTLQGIRGAEDVIVDQEPPLPQVRIDVDRAAAARYGINSGDVADLIGTGIGGKPVAQLFVEEHRYDIGVQFADAARADPEEIANLFLSAPGGALIPLAQVATVRLDAGESTITREMGKRHLTVRLNLRGRDLASFLAEARPTIEQMVAYDHARVQMSWGGQFENQQRSQARLMVIMPMVIVLMFVLLFAHFNNVRMPSLILLTVPLATVGGLIALVLRGMTINVSSAVGFIALFGVTVLNAMVMTASLHRQQSESGLPLREAILRGATRRLRPVLMTGTVAALGLLPAALARGLGSDVQRPLATVVVGGLVTATGLTLIFLPALYYFVERRLGERRVRELAGATP
jgi:cobalt-zinc-cadmium resistance protein CzcA